MEGKIEPISAPVCEMILQMKQTPYNYKHENKTYYFCG